MLHTYVQSNESVAHVFYDTADARGVLFGFNRKSRQLSEHNHWTA